MCKRSIRYLDSFVARITEKKRIGLTISTLVQSCGQTCLSGRFPSIDDANFPEAFLAAWKEPERSFVRHEGNDGYTVVIGTEERAFSLSRLVDGGGRGERGEGRGEKERGRRRSRREGERTGTRAVPVLRFSYVRRPCLSNFTMIINAVRVDCNIEIRDGPGRDTELSFSILFLASAESTARALL
ncbi:hypothetical protein KM043_008705 [Ampulex compressa]|nr:hypothetical protein KM043_008705 [Ampulex compressa]